MAGQFERMQVFLAVANSGSFAAAAARLNMTRSKVTRHVQELEQELDVQLLLRTTRQVSLTVAGQLYADRIAPLLDEISRAGELAKGQQAGLSGTLRIAAPVSFGQTFLPDLLDDFSRTHPDILLRIEMSDRFVDVMEDGFDMALRISGPPAGSSFIWRKIAAVPRVHVASPNYLSARGVPKVPADLHDHDILTYRHFSGGMPQKLTHIETAETQPVRMNPILDCDSGDVLAALAQRGKGIALLPRFLVADALESGALSTVLEPWRASEIWLTAFYPPYETLPQSVAAFTSFVEDCVASRPQLLG